MRVADDVEFAERLPVSIKLPIVGFLSRTAKTVSLEESMGERIDDIQFAKRRPVSIEMPIEGYLACALNNKQQTRQFH